MPSTELDNLVRIGKLQTEPPREEELAGHWRVLAKAHERRNMAEYEGYLERDERLLIDMLAATGILRDALIEQG